MKSIGTSIAVGTILLLVAASAAADVAAMVAEGRRLRLQGKTEAAQQKLEAAVRAEPGNYIATYNLGLTYLQAGKQDEAIETLGVAAALREKTGATDYTIYNTLGWTYLQNGDMANAEKHFLEGMKYRDKLPAVSRARLENNLGTLYLSKGDLNRAESLFSQSAQAGNELAKENLGIVTTVKKNVETQQVRQEMQRAQAPPVKPM